MKVLSQNVREYLTSALGVLSSPQKKHCLIYLCGLMWIVKFRSIRMIAGQFGNKDTDGLHHFIRHTPDKTKRITTGSQDFVAAQVRGQAVRLVIDDTPCPRQGKNIEGLGWHHGARGIIKGLCAVTSVVRASGQTWAWEIVEYCSRKSVAKEVFRSKVEIAVDIIRRAREVLGPCVTVLMDTWYSCCELLNLINLCGWTYIVAVKSNRNVYFNGRKTSARNLAKGPRQYQTIRLSKKKTYRVAKLIVELPKVGAVALFISKCHKTPRFFISNDLSLTPRQMLSVYDERFKIEFFHKDIKQFLGFGELFVRSRHSVQTHWILVAVAYNLVVLMSPRDKSKNIRRKIDRLRWKIPAQCIARFKFKD